MVYLAIDLWINSRNYVVSEGHYAIGFTSSPTRSTTSTRCTSGGAMAELHRD